MRHKLRAFSIKHSCGDRGYHGYIHQCACTTTLSTQGRMYGRFLEKACVCVQGDMLPQHCLARINLLLCGHQAVQGNLHGLLAPLLYLEDPHDEPRTACSEAVGTEQKPQSTSMPLVCIIQHIWLQYPVCHSISVLSRAAHCLATNPWTLPRPVSIGMLLLTKSCHC
jgi:hypothetical protein